MVALLILVTIADIGLGILLIAVSGFILQGVNNTGPEPGAALYLVFIALCFAAPALGWVLKRRAGPGWALAIAALPLAIGLTALTISPPS